MLKLIFFSLVLMQPPFSGLLGGFLAHLAVLGWPLLWLVGSPLLLLAGLPLLLLAGLLLLHPLVDLVGYSVFEENEYIMLHAGFFCYAWSDCNYLLGI